MAFTEADRVQIRKFLGYSATFLQADPRLESAITAVQSVADGGTRPDGSTETDIRATLTKLQGTLTAIDNLDTQQGASSVDEVKIDSAREMARLRAKGRMYVHHLARYFDTLPYSDVFSSSPADITIGPGYRDLPFNGRTGY